MVMTTTFVVCEITTAISPRRAPGKRRITASRPDLHHPPHGGSPTAARPPDTTSGPAA